MYVGYFWHDSSVVNEVVRNRLSSFNATCKVSLPFATEKSNDYEEALEDEDERCAAQPLDNHEAMYGRTFVTRTFRPVKDSHPNLLAGSQVSTAPQSHLSRNKIEMSSW